MRTNLKGVSKSEIFLFLPCIHNFLARNFRPLSLELGGPDTEDNGKDEKNTSTVSLEPGASALLKLKCSTVLICRGKARNVTMDVVHVFT